MNIVAEERARELVERHGVVGFDSHPACWDFKLGNGWVLALYPGDFDTPTCWSLEGPDAEAARRMARER